MNLPEANEYPEHDDENFSLLYEEEDAGSEETLTADEVEDVESGKLHRTYQPSDLLIAYFNKLSLPKNASISKRPSCSRRFSKPFRWR